MIEIEVARKYKLFWANKIIEREELHGCYIYEPELPYEPFLTISRKLVQLNDYIFSQLCANYQQALAAKENLESLNANPNAWCLSCEMAEKKVQDWDYNVSVFSIATPIFLISSFIEWSLSELLAVYSGSPKIRSQRGESKIEAMLDSLSDSNDLEMQIPLEFKLKLNKFRRCRNDFAHGEWSKLSALNDIDIYEYIVCTSTLFSMLDNKLKYKERRPKYNSPKSASSHR